jgi:hypothetical protein
VGPSFSKYFGYWLPDQAPYVVAAHDGGIPFVRSMGDVACLTLADAKTAAVVRKRWMAGPNIRPAACQRRSGGHVPGSAGVI